MSFSRRKFLRAGTLVAISASFPLKSLIARTRGQSGLVLDHSPLDKRLFLSRETFARCLNTEFSFNHPKISSATLRLIEVNDLTPLSGRRSAAATGRECFAAVFVGPESKSLRQETYTVNHGSLGKFEMFVVPIGNHREGRYYEAVFNRLN
jgi:hypothetical protein